MQQSDSTKSKTTRDSAQVVLEILRGRARHKYRRVHAPVFLIGKALDCDLVLGDPQFPDLHTYLFVSDRGVTARYLGNGPLLEVDGAMQVACELKHLSLLKLGTYEFRVHVEVPQGRPRSNRRRSGVDESSPAWLESTADNREYHSVGCRTTAGADSPAKCLETKCLETKRLETKRVETKNVPHLKIYLGPGASPINDRKRSA